MVPYHKLADTIIMQAVKGWRQGKSKEECEEFFCSDWFTKLTSANGAYILRKLKEATM